MLRDQFVEIDPENERVDDLQFKGLKIIQNKNKFCFGMDAVLLSYFAEARKGEQVVDLGTGTGIIPILLSGRSEARKIYGVEIQSDVADMARRSVLLNQLQDRVEIVTGDLKESPYYLGFEKFQLVVSNPPYKKAGSGVVNPNDAKAISRHEIFCTLEDVLNVAKKLLTHGGRLAMVHRPERLTDILYGMRQNGLEPKRIQVVYGSVDKPPRLLLIEGVKGGKPHLMWLPPLIVYDQEGNITPNIREIYHMDIKA
jgi:Methyltransferase small domain.